MKLAVNEILYFNFHIISFYMSTSQKFKIGKIKRCTLFHLTPVENAEEIIKSQKFKPGKGFFSFGVYFAYTYEATQLKTKHHRASNIKWTLLVADVYIGNYITMTKQDAIQTRVDAKTLKCLGINSIIGINMPTGREVVVLDENTIYNIKYAYGEKPKNFFHIKWPRITLFVYVTKNEARIIHRKQYIDKSNGPFGRAIYLYYTMDDAKKHNKNGTTFMTCDANIRHLYTMKNGETLKSKSVCRNGYKAFCGKLQGCYYYFFTNPRLITGIHHCGGATWYK